MTDIADLEAKELEELANEQDLGSLESLIIDGAESRIPITIEYNGKEFGAFIRPLTNREWNEATMIGIRSEYTTSEIELCKLGLYNKEGEHFPNEVIEKLPGGIVNTISRQIADISGVELNSKENTKILKEFMGF